MSTSLYNNRVFINKLSDYLGQEVEIFGWIHVRRDQGKMIFLEIRDKDGLIQAVVLPNRAEALEIAKKIRDEFEKKTLTEDDKYRLEKEIDTLTQKANEDIASVKEAKDAEIQQV